MAGSASFPVYPIVQWWRRIIMLSVVAAIMLTAMVSGQLMTCPQVCSCIWRNGKQTTICENQNLISIPNQISPSTQVLDLNNNNFQILPSKAFQERSLINLQKLFLPHCKLGAIADDAFYQLTNLVELDLSDNLLTHVPVKSLANATNLRRLLLNNNHIATIQAESFASLTSLKFLNLSGCKTHTIEARAFYGLRDLEYLYLHNNQLTSLPYSVVQDLPALYSFELYKNPWQCNCEMRQTREWMIRNNVGQSIPPSCDKPIRLSGSMWNSLDLDDFACQPDILSTTDEVAKVVGSNATLQCLVKGTPEPKVFWFMEQGFYNISSAAAAAQRNTPPGGAFKYHVTEERTESTVNSVLTIVSLDGNDDGVSFICSAENRAGIKSKNFTVFVLANNGAALFHGWSTNNWSKLDMASAIVGVLITLVLAFVLITLCLIRTTKRPLNELFIHMNPIDCCCLLLKGGNHPTSTTAKQQQDNKEKPHSQSTSMYGTKNPAQQQQQAFTVSNGYPTIHHHHLSLLGLDGIDKKPEIFFQAPPTTNTSSSNSTTTTTTGTTTGNSTDLVSQIPATIIMQPAPSVGYEMNHFNTNAITGLSLNELQSPEFVQQQQDTLFMNNPYVQQQQQGTIDANGLYRAVMVGPSGLPAPTMPANSSSLSSSMALATRATSPPLLLSVPNLTAHHNQAFTGDQLGPGAGPFTQLQYFHNNSNSQLSSTSPSPAPQLHPHHHTQYSIDDDDVFNANTPFILQQQPQRPPTTTMLEPIYGSRQMQIQAPPTPITVSNAATSIYGIAGGGAKAWQPSPHSQMAVASGANGWNGHPGGHRNLLPGSHHLPPSTSLSNIRCSPDEGYAEESQSTTGLQTVGQLEGTEV